MNFEIKFFIHTVDQIMSLMWRRIIEYTSTIAHQNLTSWTVKTLNQTRKTQLML